MTSDEKAYLLENKECTTFGDKEDAQEGKETFLEMLFFVSFHLWQLLRETVSKCSILLKAFMLLY